MNERIVACVLTGLLLSTSPVLSMDESDQQEGVLQGLFETIADDQQGAVAEVETAIQEMGLTSTEEKDTDVAQEVEATPTEVENTDVAQEVEATPTEVENTDVVQEVEVTPTEEKDTDVAPEVEVTPTETETTVTADLS